MSKYYTLKYQCRTCLEIYEHSADAEGCCPERYVPIYECGDCGTRHKSLLDVKECCQAADKAIMPKLT